MAKCIIKAHDGFAEMLSKLEGSSDDIAKKAIYEGAGILADEIMKNLRSVLSGESTGDLEKSFGISPIKRDTEGWNTKLGFDGYDRKGTPNQLKARILESGKKNQVKRPLIRPAVNTKRNESIQKMDEVVENEIKKLNR